MKTFLLLLILLLIQGRVPQPDVFSPEKDLIAYYSFNECDARDDTGNGSDGELFGDVGCWCGIEDDGLLLDGERDYIEFGGKVNRYFNTSDFTISFYFKARTYSLFNQSMLSKRMACDENHMLDIQLNMHFKEVITDVYESSVIYYKDISPGYDESGWHHFALVREGRIASTYIDGMLQKQGIRCSGVDISNDAKLSFANSPCNYSGRSRRFKGIIDELRVYDRALTEEDVLALYNLHPIESAEMDCVTFAPKKIPAGDQNTSQSPYLCLSY